MEQERIPGCKGPRAGFGNGSTDDVACPRPRMTQQIYSEIYSRHSRHSGMCSGHSSFRNVTGKEWKSIPEPGKPVECCRVCCGLS